MELDKHSKEPLIEFILYLEDIEKVLQRGIKKYASTSIFDELCVVDGIDRFLNSQAETLLKLNDLIGSNKEEAGVTTPSEDEEEKKIHDQMGRTKTTDQLDDLEAQLFAPTMKKRARKLIRLESVRRIMECSTEDLRAKYDADELAKVALWFKNVIMSLQTMLKVYRKDSSVNKHQLGKVGHMGVQKKGNMVDQVGKM